MPSAPDPLDELASMLGTSKRELVAAIIRASQRDWTRELRRQLRRQRELNQLDDDFDVEDD